MSIKHQMFLSSSKHVEKMKIPSQELTPNFLNSEPLRKATVCLPSHSEDFEMTGKMEDQRVI